MAFERNDGSNDSSGDGSESDTDDGQMDGHENETGGCQMDGSGHGDHARDFAHTSLILLEYGVGIALIALGLWVLYGGSGAVHVLLPERRSTVLGFGIFGAMYALAATACVLPLFLALALRSLTMPPLETVLVLGTYAVGFGILTVAITVAAAFGYALGAGRIAGHVDRVVRVAGGVLVVAGVGQLYVALV